MMAGLKMDRLSFFMNRTYNNRFRWFKENQYLPNCFSILSDDEFDVITRWFDETDKERLIGECGIAAIESMLGIISGNNICHMVELGHYAGFSTLMLGWQFKRMGKKKALFSIDIDPMVTRFTNKYLYEAGLSDYVLLQQEDSAHPILPVAAREYFGYPIIEAVFIDSSHQYEHTLRELNLWYATLASGGFIFMHDTSLFASQYDSTNQGGVNRALLEWSLDEGICIGELFKLEGNLYKDPTGMGIIRK